VTSRQSVGFSFWQPSQLRQSARGVGHQYRRNSRGHPLGFRCFCGRLRRRGKERKPKPPIVNLIFSVQGDPQSIPARIVGLPNADNAIKALVETEPANRLFAGLTGDEHLVTNHAQPIRTTLSMCSR